MSSHEKKNITDLNSERSPAPPLGKTGDESEGAHLRRVASELSGSGKERVTRLYDQLKSRHAGERASAALALGTVESQKAVGVLRELLLSDDEELWRLAIHGLKAGGTRRGWLCLESVAGEDAARLASTSQSVVKTAFDRLMAMGRTKMMDRLFRAADGHSRSIPGDVARQFAIDAVATLPDRHRAVMQLRLGLSAADAATPYDTAQALGMSPARVRTLEREAWHSIHSPAPVTDR